MLSSILLLWIAVTGLMLNHTTLLGLEGPTGFGRLAQSMGLEVQCDETAWELGTQLLVSCENGAYLGTQRIAELNRVRSATGAGGWLLVHGADQVWVLTDSAQVVDILELPQPGGKLMQLQAQAVYTQGAQRWQLDSDTLLWRPWDGASQQLVAIEPRMLATSERRAYERQASGVALSWSKLLQDLHTGRVLRGAGSFLLDVAAISLVLLAILGIAIDLRRTHVHRHQGEE